MGFLTDLLTLPVLGPIKGVMWIARQVAEQAERELYDEDTVWGQLQELEHGSNHAEIVEIIAAGIVLARIELGDEENFLVRRHRGFECCDRFVATHEERNDHVRENDDVAERQDRIGLRHIGYMVA